MFVVAAKTESVPVWNTLLRDFLLEDSHRKIDCPYSFAAHTLDYFCISDNVFNGFFVGILAVFRFLEYETKAAASPKVAAELRTILSEKPTIEKLTAWAKKAFPASSKTRR